MVFQPGLTLIVVQLDRSRLCWSAMENRQMMNTQGEDFSFVLKIKLISNIFISCVLGHEQMY
jgi:hypothetical protein